MNVLQRHTIMLIISVLFLAIFSPASLAYTDTAGHWAEKNMSYLTGQRIIGGYSDSTFRPERPVTRAEFCKIIISALRLDAETYSLENADSSFNDVADKYWAKGYIELAYELGIIQGYGDGTFKPEEKIRRDETAAILVRALNYTEKSPPALTFIDAEIIPAWAHYPVSVAVYKDLVTGFPDGTFKPNLYTSRGEAVVLINRLLDQRGDSFQLQGTVKSVDTVGRRIRVMINGEEHIFEYSLDLSVYQGDKKLKLSGAELKKILPSAGALILDQKGKITFLELFEENLEETPDNLSFNEKFILPEKIQAEKLQLLNKRAVFERQLESLVGDKDIEEDPSQSLQINGKEMNVTELAQTIGADGSGQVIAIIDSGVDPGHPDLATTTNEQLKIIDWFDLTEGGKIDTSRTLVSGNARYIIEGQFYRFGNIFPSNKTLRYGFLKESSFLKDVNNDGDLLDKFLVVVSSEGGKEYNTVLIDTDGDEDLTDEKPFKLYREKPEYFSMGLEGEGLYHFVVGNIDPQGSWVKLGCDFNGHGTHVAGIAAANGGIKGIAPGAQLMVIKALDASGETNWKILQEAIRYAATNGADIINLSLGYYDDETAGNNTLTQLISEMSEEHGVIFTVATGNKGPGIASLATPGNAKAAISVGGYISPDMWKELYGWEVARESLWYFSSIGPRKDGLMVPSVVAPGSAISTAPAWSGNKYYLAEGTSMAAPHVAGAVALLLDSMEKLDKTLEPEDIRKAITLGARPLDGFGPAEVGAGVVDVLEAWRKLLLVNESTPLLAQTYNRTFVVGEGLYTREYLPGKLYFTIKNQGEKEVKVKWDTTEEWLSTEIEETKIPAKFNRNIAISYEIPAEPGLYAAFLRGDVAGTYGYDLMALSTIIRPYQLNEENNYRISISETLEAAQYKRYFIKVLPGSEKLQVKLTVDQEGKQFKGRARFHLIKPDGTEIAMSEYVGATFAGGISKGEVRTVIENPEPGTWEIVAYSSASLSSFGLQESNYKLTASLTGVEGREEQEDYSHWFIGNGTSKDFKEGEAGYITFHVIDKSTKKPINGVMEINARLYQVKNGRMTIRGNEIK